MGKIEGLFFNDEKAELNSIIKDQQNRSEEAHQQVVTLSEKLAKRDQVISLIEEEKKELEISNRSLVRSNAAMQRELEKASRSQAQINQYCVELRMQGLDFKAETDRRCLRILSSVQSRLGFVPAGIQKHVLHLKVLRVRGHTFDIPFISTHMPIAPPPHTPSRRPCSVIGSYHQIVFRVAPLASTPLSLSTAIAILSA